MFITRDAFDAQYIGTNQEMPLQRDMALAAWRLTPSTRTFGSITIFVYQPAGAGGLAQWASLIAQSTAAFLALDTDCPYDLMSGG